MEFEFKIATTLVSNFKSKWNSQVPAFSVSGLKKEKKTFYSREYYSSVSNGNNRTETSVLLTHKLSIIIPYQCWRSVVKYAVCYYWYGTVSKGVRSQNLLMRTQNLLNCIVLYCIVAIKNIYRTALYCNRYHFTSQYTTLSLFLQ